METKTKKRIRELEERVSPLEKQAGNSRLKNKDDGKYTAFNAYIDSEGTLLTGVEKVVLPDLGRNRQGTGYSTGVVVRLVFRSLEDAAAVMDKPGELRRLEIRGAVMRLRLEGGYDFHGHKHIMGVYFLGLEQAPVERDGNTAVSAVFGVDSYTAIVDGKKLWEIGPSVRKPQPGPIKGGWTWMA